MMAIQGYAYGEIAEALGIDESTVGEDVAWIEAEQQRLAQITPGWWEVDGP